MVTKSDWVETCLLSKWAGCDSWRGFPLACPRVATLSPVLYKKLIGHWTDTTKVLVTETV